MKQGELCFTLKLPWSNTWYEPLLKLAIYNRWDSLGRTATWIFKMTDIKKVESIVGEVIEIDGYRNIFMKQKIELQDWKGDDGITIMEFPKIYQVIEHRKVEIDGAVPYNNDTGNDLEETNYEIKESKHEVPKALVETIWTHVIAHLPRGKKIKTATVAEKICQVLEIHRFNRLENNSFDFAKFFGSRRDYMTYYYYPVKVLASQKKIKHWKSGYVERLL